MIVVAAAIHPAVMSVAIISLMLALFAVTASVTMLRTGVMPDQSESDSTLGHEDCVQLKHGPDDQGESSR